MKAALDETGKLTVWPETPTEAYALRCWHSDCSKMGNRIFAQLDDESEWRNPDEPRNLNDMAVPMKSKPTSSLYVLVEIPTELPMESVFKDD